MYILFHDEDSILYLIIITIMNRVIKHCGIFTSKVDFVNPNDFVVVKALHDVYL